MRLRYLQWLVRFDLEPFLSGLLSKGTQLCAGLAMLSLMVRWFGVAQTTCSEHLQARSIITLVVTQWQSGHSPHTWSRLLLDGALFTLMLTSYCRVLASLLYVMWVERSRKQTLFAAFVLLVLTIFVLTDLV